MNSRRPAIFALRMGALQPSRITPDEQASADILQNGITAALALARFSRA